MRVSETADRSCQFLFQRVERCRRAERAFWQGRRCISGQSEAVEAYAPEKGVPALTWTAIIQHHEESQEELYRFCEESSERRT